MKKTHENNSWHQDAVEPSAAGQLLEDVVIQTYHKPPPVHGIALGTLDEIANDGRTLISIPALGLKRVSARSVSQFDSAQIGQTLAVGFEGGDPRCPIILGIMMIPQVESSSPPTEILLDGEKVVLTAEHELELRCGEASLVLTSDGRIRLRGTYITSQASATQRILGGSVNIN